MIRQLALLVFTSLLASGSALAHARLVTSTPADGSTLATPPSSVTLTFSETARVTACFIQKSAEPKRALDALPTTTAPTVTIALPALSPGAYTVSWRVVGTDSHVMSGHLNFTVTPSGATLPPTHH